MSHRGPNQDEMPIAGPPEKKDATYRDASYLGASEDDEEEVRDLGFIVEDHDDRRIALTGGWQRLDDLDTDEPLETNRSGPIPHEVSLRAQGAPEEWFATDYHLTNAEGEEQEEDFVRTSMLRTDPDMNDGIDDDTDETLTGQEGALLSTDIAGNVTGPAAGLGTSVSQDLGAGGFQILENPLANAPGAPLPPGKLSDYDGSGDQDPDPYDDIPVDLLASPRAPTEGEPPKERDDESANRPASARTAGRTRRRSCGARSRAASGSSETASRVRSKPA